MQHNDVFGTGPPDVGERGRAPGAEARFALTANDGRDFTAGFSGHSAYCKNSGRSAAGRVQNRDIRFAVQVERAMAEVVKWGGGSDVRRCSQASRRSLTAAFADPGFGFDELLCEDAGGVQCHVVIGMRPGGQDTQVPAVLPAALASVLRMLQSVPRYAFVALVDLLTVSIGL